MTLGSVVLHQTTDHTFLAELPNAVYDCSWHSVLTAGLTCKWPGSVVPLTNIYYVESTLLLR